MSPAQGTGTLRAASSRRRACRRLHSRARVLSLKRPRRGRPPDRQGSLPCREPQASLTGEAGLQTPPRVKCRRPQAARPLIPTRTASPRGKILAQGQPTLLHARHRTRTSVQRRRGGGTAAPRAGRPVVGSAVDCGWLAPVSPSARGGAERVPERSLSPTAPAELLRHDASPRTVGRLRADQRWTAVGLEGCSSRCALTS